MPRSNALLVLVTAALAALLGLTIWTLVDRAGTSIAVAERGPVDSDPMRPDPPARAELAELQDPPALVQPPADPQHGSLRDDERRVESVVTPVDLSSALRFLQRILPDRFGTLTAADAAALTSLDLRGAQITDAELAQLAALPALESVSLRGTAISDAGLAHLSHVPRLTAVDLRGTKVSGMGIIALPTHRIEALHLTDTQVSAEDLRSLPAMPNLHVFNLNGLEVDDDALAHLDHLPSIEHLELDRTAITDDGVRGLLARNPSIRRIELRETSVTPAVIAELSQAYPGVQLVRD